MQALMFWKTVTIDQENHLETILAFLDEQHMQYCVVGGQAVNAYVEPLVSLDLAVATNQMDGNAALLTSQYQVERFPHSLNLVIPGSDLRVQIQTDRRYGEFVKSAEPRNVLGLTMPVARLEDVLQGKIWAAQDADRRASKRQKDLADIARIVEAYPELKSHVPPDVLAKLI